MIEETQNGKVVESPLVGDPTLDINPRTSDYGCSGVLYVFLFFNSCFYLSFTFWLKVKYNDLEGDNFLSLNMKNIPKFIGG